MAIEWNLLNVPNIGETFSNAYKQGQENRALTDYARAPDNMNALNALAPFKPDYVVQQKQAMAQQAAKQQQEAKIHELTTRAVQGDPQARSELAYYNSDLYLKLGDAQKKQVDGIMHTIGQQAFNILQLPEEQQPAALQTALQTLQAQGVDTSQFKMTGNVKQDLLSALAQSGQLDNWEQFSQIKYQPIGEAGLMGTQYGRPLQQGGQVQNFAQNVPQPGHVEDGYRFKGGNPADPNAWEPVSAGGPTQPASGGFRP